MFGLKNRVSELEDQVASMDRQLLSLSRKVEMNNVVESIPQIPGYPYAPTHEVYVASAIRKIVDYLGVQFKYEPHTPASLELCKVKSKTKTKDCEEGNK